MPRNARHRASRPAAILAMVLALAVPAAAQEATQRAVPYGPLPRQTLDITAANATGPILFFLYGGSWRTGDRRLYRFIGAAFAARGITTVIPDYRLFPEVKFPAFVEDAALAYAYVRRTFGPCRPIIIAGHSAGAHIGALLAFDRSYLAKAAPGAAGPAGFIGLAGPYAFDPTTWPSTKEIFAGADPDKARPIRFAAADAPPALLLHGQDDTTVQPYNPRDFAAAIAAAQGAVTLEELPGIGHLGIVLAISVPLRWRAPVLDRMSAFIAMHGAPPPGCDTPTR